MQTIRQVLNEAMVKLRSSGSDSPKLDAQLLLMKVYSYSQTQLLVHDNDPIAQDKLNAFNELLEQRLIGHPIAHLLAQKDFWDLTLKVTKDTLIPRPDTEVLVEQALNVLNNNAHAKVLDLGTGSGAIILALKNTIKSLEAYAIDQSLLALEVAKENAALYQLEVNFMHGSWFEPLKGDHKFDHYFDVIVSNPPYIEEGDEHLSKGDVRFEPLSALVSGKDGLDDIKAIASVAPRFLKTGGCLLFEHGYNQGLAVAALLTELGYSQVTTVKDYGHNDRVTLGFIK